MKLFSIILLLIVSSIALATDIEKNISSVSDLSIKEGVTILDEEHTRTSGVSNVPSVKTEIRTLSPDEMND